MKNIFIKTRCILVALFLVLMNSSCENELTDSSLGHNDELTLTVSNSELVLDESQPNDKLTFDWTTGTNKGTSASISYILQIDKEGNNYATAIDYELGNNAYTYSINSATLNAILLDTFGVKAGGNQSLEARVIATVANSTVKTQTASTKFSVTTYLAVAKELYIIGSATSAGGDISNALPLKLSSIKPGTFVYQGPLSTGDFKLPVSKEDCFCQDFYTKSKTDATKMVHNLGGSGDDLRWEITQAGQYKITADLLNLKITIEAVEGPAFSIIYIVGDASPSGWDVNNPKAFTHNPNNPFIFTYEANLTQGSFKILAGAKGDFCGEWYRPLTEGQALSSTAVEQNSGCTVDNKWNIGAGEVGRYKITLDTQNNTIKIQKVNLYIIGDGGPNGWNIATPTAMTYSNGNYIFTGALGSDNATGEFKISKFKGDWCDGDWINPATANQSILNGSFITTQNCDGPDNKWKLQTGNAGSYQISINLDTNVMTIVSQ